MSCDTGRQDAVRHIDAAFHTLKQIVRASNAHIVARFFLWQKLHAVIQHIEKQFLWFSDRKSADRVARKIQIYDRGRAFLAQILIEAALHDAEQ